MGILNISNIHQPLKLFRDINASYSVSLQAPNNLSSNYTLTLPSNSSNEKSVLKTDGSGILTWGVPNVKGNKIEGDLTIGNYDSDILTIASKIIIPYGEKNQVLIKQSDNSIKFETPTPNNEYYQIKGNIQSFFIQSGSVSISDQTKWSWGYAISSNIIRSSSALLSWNSSTEFTFNKTGIYRISIRHSLEAVLAGHLRDMSCIMSNTSNTSILTFSQHFRSFVTSDHEVELFNSRLIEISSITTGYRWSCRTGNNSWVSGEGVWHKQDKTYFTVELIK
jgi:hypothetical protein|tara:strand:+ start:247 stop:1083 length:837 start_codon:yes stop_codon:yes gene_type:complete